MALSQTNFPLFLTLKNGCISLILVKLFNYICLLFNDPISSSKFSFSLKCANKTPFSKKSLEKANLLVISKIFEKILRKQLSTFFKSILSTFQCGFWRGFSTQYCLLFMLDKWKKAVDSHQAFGTLPTDLSKN